jgi:hypothetical protein
MIYIIIATIVIVLAMVFVWSLCKAAAMGDEMLEREYERRELK